MKATNLTLLPIHLPWQHSFKLVAKTLAWEVGRRGCQAPPISRRLFSVLLGKSTQGVFGTRTGIWVP